MLFAFVVLCLGDFVNNRKASEWYKFKEEIRAYFEALGASSTTNARLKGTRGRHDIDVLVRLKFSGYEILWLVEEKTVLKYF